MGRKRKLPAGIDRDDIKATLHQKPTSRQVRKRRWLQAHWDFMRNNQLDPKRIKDNLPASLPARAAHIVAIWRAVCEAKGKPLEVVNVSQSIHRVGVQSSLVMPCITPNGQFWVERVGRIVNPIEKLLCMGLPAQSLDLGGLSDREIESLAGNGMHSWVLPLACARGTS